MAELNKLISYCEQQQLPDDVLQKLKNYEKFDKMCHLISITFFGSLLFIDMKRKNNHIQYLKQKGPIYELFGRSPQIKFHLINGFLLMIGTKYIQEYLLNQAIDDVTYYNPQLQILKARNNFI